MSTLLDEFLPVHPRKASASRRRRHHAQLPFRLHQYAPDAATILLMPIWTDALGEPHCSFVARALTLAGEQVRLPAGGSRDIAALVQGAFPAADWNQPQTWHAATNELTTWHQERRVA